MLKPFLIPFFLFLCQQPDPHTTTAMSGIAAGRLREERKAWRKDHPHGFFARASRNPDGSTNMMMWQCGVPGKKGTPHEGGLYKIEISFTEDYPSKAPLVKFKPVIFHPNVYGSGKICLSIIDDTKGWQPTITIKQILLGVQDLLNNPNNADPAQSESSDLLKRSKAAYEARVRQEVKKHPPL